RPARGSRGAQWIRRARSERFEKSETYAEAIAFFSVAPIIASSVSDDPTASMASSRLPSVKRWILPVAALAPARWRPRRANARRDTSGPRPRETSKFTDAHRLIALEGQVGDRVRVGALWSRSVRLAGFDFQACSFNHSIFERRIMLVARSHRARHAYCK